MLEAILGEAIKVEKDILRLTIQLEARLDQVTKIVWRQAKLKCSNEDEYLEAKVEYFPPVKLVIQLTPAYPTSSPPEGSIIADWLPLRERDRLALLLTQLWERADGEVVIWDWVQVGGYCLGSTRNTTFCLVQVVQEQLEILLQHGLELADRQKMK